MAETVGYVGQDPLAGFVTDTVEEELAYAMEQLGLPPDVMRKRVEETLDLLGIADLRAGPLRSLSGGQQQRVAIGSVLTAQPRVLVLDEPTSALDPTAAEDVLSAMTRLVHDLGVTVVVAEHRLERVVHHCDRVVLLRGDGTTLDGAPDRGPARRPRSLHRWCSWRARRVGRRSRCRCGTRAGKRVRSATLSRRDRHRPRGRILNRRSEAALTARGITVVYGATRGGPRGRSRPVPR